jgi:TetR/AcrR family transcriptional repressor of nem operon
LYLLLCTNETNIGEIVGKREDIIEATKALLWENGYEATSPRDIQEKSQSGQGSFYHHFPSKQALALIAIQEVVDERISDFDKAMALTTSFRERLFTYVAQNRKPLLGCRVGRLVWDSAVKDEALRAPLEQYFGHLETRLVAILEDEAASGKVMLKMPARQIALVILSVVQGSFTVSRAMKRSRAADARTALLAFLEIAVVDR